ncbi:MAG: hypothetical protein Q8N23_24560 [Archangium sp.]|nr:hypothetical protein [Archangium sp.]MDP3155867.1 hypothetical protein [Archangium sp.]MDP3575423.1 hypothetical protein [Archangium sp.]
MPTVKRNTPAVTQQPAPRAATMPAKPQPATSSSGWVKPAAPGGIGGASIDSKTARTAFWHSPYTNADAKAAKKAFNLPSIDAAKELIGRAVITRNEGPLEQKGISRARYDNHDCTVAFQRSPYSEADAKQALKKLPFLKNLAEAKEYIGLKVVNKTEDILTEVGVTRSEFDSHDMLAAFKRSGYSAGDVEQAKKKFDFLKGASTQEVKEYMGLKVLNDYTSMMTEKGITAARDRHEIP